MSDTITAGRELRSVPLSSIELAEGHNPRGVVAEDAGIRTLADNLAERGMLQPLVVCQTDSGYRLIAGERRYRAAVLGSLMEVPVAIDHRPPNHPDLEEEHFADAMSENLLREEMSVLTIARGFHRQKTRGNRTVKELASMYGRSQADIKIHLAVLALSDGLQQKIDAGIVPMTVVAKLAQLARVHRALPDLAVSRVLKTESDLTWPEFNRWPITVVSNSYAHLGGELPSDVFEMYSNYRTDRFTLDDKTTEAFAELLKRNSRTAADFTIRFDRAAGDAAAALHALHNDKEGRSALIVGQDVADQLASDAIQAHLKRQQTADRARKDAKTTTPAANSTTDRPAETEEQRASRQREEQVRAEIERRAELDAGKAAREAACAHNDRLGAALFRDMARLKVDDRVMKILTAVPIGARLDDIAMSGARFGFPDWVTLEPGRGDVPKRIYLNSGEAKAKAHEYLDGAKTPGEIAGRSLALVVMAMNAQQEAVAQSHRTYFTVGSHGMPWKDEVLELLDEIAAEIVGPEILGAMYSKRNEQREIAAATAKRKAALTKRLARALKNVKKLSDEELDEIPALGAAVHRGYRPEEHEALAEVTSKCDREHARRIEERTAQAPDTVESYKEESKARRRLNESLRTVLDRLGDAKTIDMLNLDDLAEFDEAAQRFVRDKGQLAQVKAASKARRQQLAPSTTPTKQSAPADTKQSTETQTTSADDPKETHNS